jgi:glucose-1-phosphate thymidylyltransferase
MIDKGARLHVEDVQGWYDAGEVGTLLDTNRTMLETRRSRRPDVVPDGVTVIDPVFIEEGVTLRNCTVGPNVSVGAGSTIEDSTIRDAIIGQQVRITRSTLRASLVGDAATVDGLVGVVNVGDHTVVRAGG